MRNYSTSQLSQKSRNNRYTTISWPNNKVYLSNLSWNNRQICHYFF